MSRYPAISRRERRELRPVMLSHPLLPLLALLAFLNSAAAAPPGQQGEEDVIYDQRQNGTDNFRVQMSDVTLVVAPAEALLAVAPSDLFESQLKPKLADSHKPSRSKHRLANLLMNVLQKNHK